MLWNSLKTAVRLNLRLSNPYKINPQLCLLNQKNTKARINFMQRKQINRNSHLFRFALPDQDKCLGLSIGQYIKMTVDGITRGYSTVSRIDQPGIVDIIVRDLRKQNGKSSITTGLMNLKQGDSVPIEGPFTQYLYKGYGQLQWPGKQSKKYRHIGIIAYGSGITGVYQLIDAIMPNYDNKTGFSLLWVGDQMDDFIFLEQFSMLAQQQRLNFNVAMRDNKPGWIGPFGKLTKSHFKDFMPPNNDDTALLLICGAQEYQQLKPLLAEVNYKNFMPPAV